MEKSSSSSEINVLHQGDHYDVVEIIQLDNEKVGMVYKTPKVVILPYIKDGSGIPYKLGVITEPNYFRKDPSQITLITGKFSGVDYSIFDTAIRELYEESGYKVIDEFRWTFLGKLSTSKNVNLDYVCYGVDITNIPREKKHKVIKFDLIGINQAINENDCFILSLLMKLYNRKFKNLFNGILF